MAEIELGIGGALPGHEHATTIATGVRCALCDLELIPHPTAGLFTVYDVWWVCDDCGHEQAPHLMTAVRAIRDLGGKYTLRQVFPREALWTADFAICPECRLDQYESDDFWNTRAATNGWAVVDTETDRPLCEACASAVPADVHRAVNALRRALAQRE